LFPKQGRELTADFNYNSSSNSGSGNYSTQYYHGNGSILGQPALQRLISSGSNTFWTVQSDYTSPVGKGKFEGGLRAAVRDNKNVSENSAFNYDLDKFVVIPSASSNYKYNDQVYAAYTTYSNKLGENLSYQLGLRAE